MTDCIVMNLTIRERSLRARIGIPAALTALGTLVVIQALLDPLFSASFVGQATSSALSICAILPFLMIFVRRGQSTAYRDETGNLADVAKRLTNVLLFVIVLIAILLASAKLGDVDPHLREDLPDLRSWLLIVPTFIGQVAVEELIFRFILPAALALIFTSKTSSLFWGVVLANLAFAWWHIPLSLPTFIDHFAFGLLMALLYARTKSLLVLIVVHSSNNFFILLVDAPLVAGTEFVTLLIVIKYVLLFWIGASLFSASPRAITSAQNVSAHDGRQVSLDILRGVALIMIVLENALFYSVPEWTNAAPAQEDRLVRSVFSLLLEYRGLPIFCILLGFTAHLMVTRYADGRQRLNLRAKTFIAMGAIHGLFVFPGDILAIFGISLLVLLWLNRRTRATQRVLLWLTGCGFIVQAVVAGWGSAQTGTFSEFSVGILTFPEASVARAIEWLLYVLTVPFHVSAVLFPILIGFTTWKKISASHVAEWKITTGSLTLLAISMVLCLPNAIQLSTGWEQSRSGFFVFGAQLGGMVGALGLWLIAVRLRDNLRFQHPRIITPPLNALATLGRGTLSLYLGSSAMFFVALSPAGLNLFAYFPLWAVWSLALLGLLGCVLITYARRSPIGWAEQAQKEFTRPLKEAPPVIAWNQDSGDSHGAWIRMK